MCIRDRGDDWARWATVVPMGVDPQFLTADPPAERAPSRPVEFVYVGRLTRRRRLERILDAATLVRRQTDNFRVRFMGYDASEGLSLIHISSTSTAPSCLPA